MIQNLNVGILPITFTFSKGDIIRIDEKKKRVILADQFTRTYKDTISDGDTTTEDPQIVNQFPTLRNVELPYENILVEGNPLLDYIKNNLESGFTLNVEGSALSVTDAKIILADNATVTAG